MADDHASPAAEFRLLRRSRWRRLFPALAIAVAGLVLLVWFLPAIVASTSLKDRLVKSGLPWFRGEVILGDLSLGWLSPIRVRHLVVRDEQGAPLAEAAEAATSRTLWSLLRDSRQMGEIRVVQPTLHAVVRADGSNLEDALAPFFAAESTGGLSCVIRISEGACVFRDAATAAEYKADAIEATIALPAEASQPHQVQVAARVVDGGAAGQMTLAGDWRPGATPAGVGQAKFEARDFSLAVLAPILTRCGVSAEVAGRAQLRGEIALLESGEQTLRLEQAAITGLSVRSAQYLGEDRFHLERLDASGEATAISQTLTLRDGHLTCDLGQLHGSGTLSWEALTARGFASAVRGSTFDGRGEIDLAKLSQLLPHTLRLRDGLSVTSGVVRLACAIRDDGPLRAWEGKLETSNIAAVHHGKPFTWDRPLEASLLVRDDAAGPLVERFTCESDFFRAQGRGAIAEGSLTLEGDLSKLARELSRFVDLGEMQFGGVIQGQAQWRRGENAQTTAEGNLRLTGFEWSLPGRRPWREAQLAAEFSAAGLVDESGLRRIDRGQVELRAGSDSALVQLTAPVESWSETTLWPISCRAGGELATWLPRCENFAELPAWSVEGRVAISATGGLSRTRAAFEKTTATIESLYFQGAGLTIREPRVEVQGDLAWSDEARTVALQQATLSSSSLAFRAQNVAVHLPPSSLTAAGDIDFRGDVQRISQWWQKPNSPSLRQMAGMAVGRVRVEKADRGVRLQGTTDVERFVYAVPASAPATRSVAAPAAQTTAWTTVWNEPRLRLACDLAYGHDTNALDVKNISVASEAVQVVAQGKIDEATTACRADLTGQYDYDLAKLLVQLRPWVGDDLTMTGRGPRPFTLQGPLVPMTNPSTNPAPGIAPRVSPELVGKTTLAWTSLAYYGIKTGAGLAPIELRSGVLTLGPLDLPVSEGRLTATPKLLFNASPLVLALDAGPVLQNVRISPEMCRSWLKYVTPLVADATQAEGRFSLALTQPAQAPLENPAHAALQGVMNIHSAQVGPGPLSRQILGLADQIKAAVERKPFAAEPSGANVWLQIPEQAMPFEIAGGRVFHRDLVMTAKDVVLRTRGSVGLDQSLDLLTEVPVQDRWVEREPLLASFRGQTLQIPMSGTLSSPRLDRRGVERFAAQMMGDAAKRLLEQQLNANPDVQRALERLLPRR